MGTGMAEIEMVRHDRAKQLILHRAIRPWLLHFEDDKLMANTQLKKESTRNLLM